MLKRLLPAALAFAFCFLPLRAAATDYTDIWYLPAESGWGVNMVQSDNFIFATFFIYGQNNTPTWYTAQMYSDANGNFAGNLYATMGTYFAAPWNPGNLTTTLAGTASFVPTNPYQGTLTYGLTGGPTVTKNIQRQALTTIALGATYIGGQAGVYSGGGNNCNGTYTDTFNLTVTQPGDGTATFQFTYPALTCTWSGTLVQFGKVYTMPNASYQCSDGTRSTATMDEIQATPYGIEAIYFAPSGVQGNAACSESANFSGTLTR
jgi:hypothetical protein